MGLEALDATEEALGGRIQVGAGGLQQGDLDRHAGVVALPDGRERAGQLVDRADQRRRSDRGGLGLQAGLVGGGDDEGGGDFAGRLSDQQVAQVGEQVAGELRGVAAGAGHLLDPEQDRLRILGDDCVDRF